MAEEEKEETTENALAEAIKAQTAAMEAMRAQPAATAPPDKPVGPSYDETLETAATDFGKAVEEGKGGEGIKKFLSVVQGAQQAANQPVDMEKNPAITAIAKGVVRTVKGEYKDLMGDFPEEANDAVAALKIEDRMDEDKVRDALRGVKSRHIDHFVAKASKVAMEEAAKTATVAPPQNSPVSDFGEDDETELHGLEQADRAWCQANGVSYKNMAFNTKGAQDQMDRRDAPKDQWGGVEVLPRSKDGKIKPGSF